MAQRCPKCGGTGFELNAGRAGVLDAVPCDCRSRSQGERLLRASRIPRRYDHCTLEEFNPLDPSQEQARATVREWIDLWPAVDHGLMLLGRPGTGKTHLAVAVARELIQAKGAHVLFYEQRELLRALQGTFDAGAAQRESEVLGPALDSEVLILDDLGAGRVTAWSSEVLHDVIAQRYNENRLMIITSNRVLEDEPPGAEASKRLDAPLTLRDRLGDALLSRLYEMCLIVKLTGKDDMDYRRDIMNARIRR